MKICMISDTHEQHQKIQIDPCEVLIHAGDATMYGALPIFTDFLDWLEAQPAQHKIYVPGNHDMIFERDPALTGSLLRDHPGITCLLDERVTIEGLNFWGAPWTQRCGRWAFSYPEGQGYRLWDRIPQDTDVLITHQPPFGILDWLEPKTQQDSVGCKELLNRIKELKQLKLWCGGHIHESHGTDQIDDVQFVNAAMMDERYRLVHQPTYIDL